MPGFYFFPFSSFSQEREVFFSQLVGFEASAAPFKAPSFVLKHAFVSHLQLDTSWQPTGVYLDRNLRAKAGRRGTEAFNAQL